MTSILDGRNILRYFGSGSTRARWIIPLMQMVPHTGFCAPFLGGANVEIQKPPVKAEWVGDINGRVTNFMSVLRDNPKKLIDQLDLTPYSEDEYILSREPSPDPIEDARRFFIQCWGSYDGGPTPGTFRTPSMARRSPPADDISGKEELLYAAAARIKKWNIFNRDYKDILGMVIGKEWSSEVLIYCDPPFVKKNVTKRNKYGVGFTEDDHREMAGILTGIGETQAAFVSGYAFDRSGRANDLYTEIFPGWSRYDKELRTNSDGKRVESLYVSPFAQRFIDTDPKTLWNQGVGIRDNNDYSNIGLFGAK